ncbi:MAG: Nudix family hydrolase [Gammaproteobacteria bacterium]
MNTAPALMHVVVGVIKNAQHKILISKRPAHVHQGGLWEFPGGKVEPGETPQQALRRELHEECGIDVAAAHTLGSIRHDYADRTVLLEVYVVETFSAEPRGREGQPLRWVHAEHLRRYAFPAANLEIIKMLERSALPELCLITGRFSSVDDFAQKLTASLARGVRLVQLRLKSVDPQQQEALVKQAIALCRQQQAMLLLSPDLYAAHATEVAGMHLTSQQLYEFKQRPLAADKLLSASVHHAGELQQAQKLQADFVLLSPVLPTSSHPDAAPLGWDCFRDLVAGVRCPVFALGGVDASHLPLARAAGAHGIAAISALWGAQA